MSVHRLGMRALALAIACASIGTLLAVCPTAMAAFALPDNRVWEMVSPLDKNGGNVAGIRGDNGGGVVQTSPNGDETTFVSISSFGKPQGAPSGSQYLSTRKPDGWATQNVTTPLRSGTYFDAGAGTPYKAFSDDLSRGLLPSGEGHGRVENPPLGDAPPGYKNFYVHETSGAGGTEALLTREALLVSMPEESPEDFNMVFKGATPDLGHVAISSATALTTGAGSNPNGDGNLYEWAAGHFQAVNVLPGAVGGQTAVGRAVLGSGANEGGTISDDGSRVFWSHEGPPAVGSLELFVRENGTNTTTQLDAVRSGPGLNAGELQSSQFWTASRDGAKAFFTSNAPLTSEANTGPPCGGSCRRSGSDLYEFEATTGNLTDLTPDHEDVNGADVLGVLGASEGGSSYVYFVATAALPGVGANAEGHAPHPGGNNLYVWHEGEGTTFIATLSSDDQLGSEALLSPNDWDPSIARRTARVTPDGRRVVFMSDESLTGYDNRDAVTSQRDEEVFLYDVGSGALTCASCNPRGERPIGPSAFPGATIFANEGERGGAALHESHVLSENGERVFFDSNDALALQDTNHRQDVYEYESGRVYLVSGGASNEDSSFVDASATGDDVFFITKQQLVSQDADQLMDLYDARVNGGFPEIAPAGGPCQGEGCRLPASPAPSLGFAATAVLGGEGNLPPAVQPGVKGKTVVKARAKIKAKHRKRAGKAKRGSRKARRAGRGSAGDGRRGKR